MRCSAAVCVLAVVALLVGCGGGGETESPPAIAATQGLYVGMEVTDSFWSIPMTNTVLVLEDGEVWASGGETATGAPAFFAYGACEFREQRATLITAPNGTTQVDPNSVVTKFGADNALVAVNGAALSTTSVTCVETRTPDGAPRFESASTVHQDGVAGILLPAAPTSTSQPAYFDYAKAAVLTDVAGSWVFYAPKSTPPQANLEVAASGAISGTNEATGCSYTGSLMPRPGGRNVFNVAVTLSGCADAGVYGGVAYSYVGTPLILGGVRTPVALFQLLAINSAKTAVFHLLMQRA